MVHFQQELVYIILVALKMTALPHLELLQWRISIELLIHTPMFLSVPFTIIRIINRDRQRLQPFHLQQSVLRLATAMLRIPKVRDKVPEVSNCQMLYLVFSSLDEIYRESKAPGLVLMPLTALFELIEEQDVMSEVSLARKRERDRIFPFSKMSGEAWRVGFEIYVACFVTDEKAWSRG